MVSNPNNKKNSLLKLSKLKEAIKSSGKTAISEKDLEESLRIVYDSIESTIGGFIITDGNGNIVYANPAFIKMFRYKNREDVIGGKVADLFLDDNIKSLLDMSIIIERSPEDILEFIAVKEDNTPFNIEVQCSEVLNENGEIIGRMASFYDITKRKRLESEKDILINKLQDALNHIKTLKGLIPICANCKQIRDDDGYWHQVETYVTSHTEAKFTHGICPDCLEKLYPGYYTKEELDAMKNKSVISKFKKRIS